MIIVSIGAEIDTFVAAFDKRTGKTVWEVGDSWGAGYASPVPAVVHGRRRVFVFSGMGTNPTTGGLLAMDPLTGAIDLRYPFQIRNLTVTVNASTPVVVGNQVFISTAYRTGGVLINVKPNGLLLPLALALGAWMILRSALALALAAALLAGAHSAPGADDVSAGLIYPLVALAA